MTSARPATLAAFSIESQDAKRLVPRTRSSHDFAATTFANLGFKSGTRIIELLVSLDSEVRIRTRCNSCELRNRDTSAANPKFARFRGNYVRELRAQKRH